MQKIIPITGFATVPSNVTDEQFNEWLQFTVGKNESIDKLNPLYGIEQSKILNVIIEKY